MWCVPDPSSALVCLSLLPCARYWCARRTDNLGRISTHAVRVTTPLHIPCPSIFSPCPPPSSPFTNHNLTTHDLFLFLHLLPPSNSTRLPACIQHPVPCIDCSAARLHRPKPKPEPKPAPARHRKTHSETRSSRSLLYRSVHTLESTPNLQPVCLDSSCSRGITRPSSRPPPPMTSARPLAFIFALQ